MLYTESFIKWKRKQNDWHHTYQLTNIFPSSTPRRKSGNNRVTFWTSYHKFWRFLKKKLYGIKLQITHSLSVLLYLTVHQGWTSRNSKLPDQHCNSRTIDLFERVLPKTFWLYRWCHHGIAACASHGQFLHTALEQQTVSPASQKLHTSACIFSFSILGSWYLAEVIQISENRDI
jgi:hypothetical protein